MADIRITAQYYENYSDTDTPHWKPKGGQVFVIEEASMDMVMYTNKDVLIKVLTKLVENQSNEHFKYNYLEHEVDFIGESYAIHADDLKYELFNTLENEK